MRISKLSNVVLSSLLVIGCFIVISAKRRYEGYQLIELKPETPEQRQFVKDHSDTDLELDFWSEGRDVLDVLVPPQRHQSFTVLLREIGLPYKIKSYNIQSEIDAEDRILKEAAEKRKGNKLPLDYNVYNTYEDIVAELDALVARCPTGLSCETVVHGLSYEGREIKGLRVYRQNASQKKIWIDATIHAREWLATAVSLKIISNIVDGYGTDPALTALVDRYDWYLLPIVNVDGYSFTWSDDRLWRKNRSPTPGAACIGTDLNRNFDDGKWGTSGSSSNACSQTFHGSAPASEVETQAMQNAMLTHSADLLTTVNLHTYGRMLLTPWSYEQPAGRCYVGPDDAQLLAAANAAADAIEATHNTVWTRGPFCTVLYPGSGTSVDFGKGKAGIKYTFLPELRGEHFIVPPSEIQPAYEETWNGIRAAISHIENNGK